MNAFEQALIDAANLSRRRRRRRRAGGLGAAYTVTLTGLTDGVALQGSVIGVAIDPAITTETVTYQWQADGVSIVGATSASYTVAIGTDGVADGSLIRCVATVDGQAYTSNARRVYLVLPISGSLIAQESGSDTIAAAGVFVALVAGSLAAQETGSDTMSAAGTVIAPSVTGSLIAQETGSDTMSATGTVIAPDITGALAAQETGADTMVATGTVPNGAVLPLTANGFRSGHSIVANSKGISDAFRVAAGTPVTRTAYHTGGWSTTTFRWEERNTLVYVDGLTFEQLAALGWDYHINIVSMRRGQVGLDDVTFEGPSLVNFYNLFAQYNPTSRRYLLTWTGGGLIHPSAPGDTDGVLTLTQWRALMPQAQATWQAYLDYTNANKAGGDDVEFIRCCEVLGLIYDEIEAGRGYPGATFYDLLIDNVHASEFGEWVIGATEAYTLYGMDPINQPLSVTFAYPGQEWSTYDASLTEAQRAFVAPLIRQVVDNGGYDMTLGGGVSGSMAATETGTDTMSASGTVTIPAVSGSLAATETGADTMTATGTASPPGISGSMTATETGADTMSASGTVEAPPPSSWSVSGGELEITITSMPTVTAPTVSAGELEITVAG